MDWPVQRTGQRKGNAGRTGYNLPLRELRSRGEERARVPESDTPTFEGEGAETGGVTRARNENLTGGWENPLLSTFLHVIRESRLGY